MLQKVKSHVTWQHRGGFGRSHGYESIAPEKCSKTVRISSNFNAKTRPYVAENPGSLLPGPLFASKFFSPPINVKNVVSGECIIHAHSCLKYLLLGSINIHRYTTEESGFLWNIPSILSGPRDPKTRIFGPSEYSGSFCSSPATQG